jgi:hypothetical protein
MSTYKPFRTQSKIRGAALITSLVLLTVLTLLSISVMSTSRLEMTMASNVQTSNNAFQLAESAADTLIARAIDNTTCINDLNPGICDIGDENISDMSGTRSASNRFIEYIDNCPVTPQKGNSFNSTAAFHFVAEAAGTSDYRGGTATHTQGWYVCRAN